VRDAALADVAELLGRIAGTRIVVAPDAGAALEGGGDRVSLRLDSPETVLSILDLVTRLLGRRWEVRDGVVTISADPAPG
jgi:hypothetical protein